MLFYLLGLATLPAIVGLFYAVAWVYGWVWVTFEPHAGSGVMPDEMRGQWWLVVGHWGFIAGCPWSRRTIYAAVRWRKSTERLVFGTDRRTAAVKGEP